MANILILGGGFGGVVAAESLARLIPAEHQITLISRSPTFIFYPELVRLAFGNCEPMRSTFIRACGTINRQSLGRGGSGVGPNSFTIDTGWPRTNKYSDTAACDGGEFHPAS